MKKEEIFKLLEENKASIVRYGKYCYIINGEKFSASGPTLMLAYSRFESKARNRYE